MGNSQHRYITTNEASEIIGIETWNRLRGKLERGPVKTIDFALFCNIVQTRFERIPIVLCECLFRAFTADFHQKLEIEGFLSSFAVLYSQDLGLKKRFLFRIYETPTGGNANSNTSNGGGGGIERKRMEEILYLAYGDRLKGRYQSVNKFLDGLFQKKKEVVSKTKFEQWQGRLDLLSDWVLEVLSVFVEPLPPRLLALQRKYSSSMEAEMLMQKHSISVDLYQRLYHLYFSHCQVTFSKPELTLQQWLAWVTPDYLSKEIASILFAASTETFKPVWRFLDFAEFALIYATGSLQTKASSLTAAFLKYAVIAHAQRSDRRKSGTSSSIAMKPVSLSDEFHDSTGSGSVTGSVTSSGSVWQIGSKNPDFEDWISEALTYMIYLLCQPIEVHPRTTDYSSPEDYYPPEEEEMLSTDQSLLRSSLEDNHSHSHNPLASTTTPTASTEKRRRSYSLNLSAEPHDKNSATFKQQIQLRSHSIEESPSSRLLGNTPNSNTNNNTTSTSDSLFSLDSLRVSPEELVRVVPPPVLEELMEIFENPKQSADCYVNLITRQIALLPVLRDISITASVLFGVAPPSPTSEKEFITELTLRYLKLYPPSPTRPYGPVGTEWYLLPKNWIDSWRMFVGKNRLESSESLFSGHSNSHSNSNSNSHSTSNLSNSNSITAVTSPTSGLRRNPLAPGLIDNWSLLKKTGAKALLPDLLIGQDFEVVPPAVYMAFSSWYGGGPAVSRRVVFAGADKSAMSGSPGSSHPTNSNHLNNSNSSNNSKEGKEVTEIEFYPLIIVIVECDQQGKVSGQPREMLFSKSITINEMINELSQERKLDASKIRLWNYLKPHWKDQYILSPELTLSQANLVDGQVVLLESSQTDGSWPRSLLHAYLDSEEKQRERDQTSSTTQEGEGEEEEEEESTTKTPLAVTATALTTTSDNNQPVKSHSLTVRRNNGLVGLDNLGNTCYLNSSLQALLHTDLLMEYFLSNHFLRDINPANKHGFGGRVATVFGKLVMDLWTNTTVSLTPRYFFNEIAALREQFAGNEQHDAHELLAFLLDALSEDLNLVTTKPYTIQPDSADSSRSDEELADIWWENHLKRDRSVIQALFTGQFKSVMTCSSCHNYSSARFEPFNFLTVPIPEDLFRVMVVIVVPRQLEQTARVAVRVPKSGVVEDLVEQVRGLGFFEGMSPPTTTNSNTNTTNSTTNNTSQQYFVAGELVNGRIKSFINLDRKVDTIRDNELLVIFHVTALPKKMDKYYANKYKPPLLEAANPNPHTSNNHNDPTTSNNNDPTTSNNSAVTHHSHLTNPSDEKERVSGRENHLLAPPSNESDYQSSTNNPSSGVTNVRVAFSQRRVTFVEGAFSGVAGFDFFRLEPFGMPILEVLPSRVRGSDLYRLMHKRLAGYYKGTIKEFVKNQQQLQLSSSHSSFLSSSGNSNSNISNSMISHSDSNAGSGAIVRNNQTSTHPSHSNATTANSNGGSNYFSLGSAAADCFEEITPVTTEEVVAGPIPSKGFSLRLITGGTGATVCCSRCPWINRCQGCLLPDAEDVEYELLDGESLAVDWHYLVFEDLLDTQLASSLITHPSIAQEKAYLQDTKVPLSKCLDKFNEQETLEGVICPRCQLDNSLKKSFMLWRLPPVLIIQLKRFQFDRTSRRKLNNRIDFPLEGLDLTDYIAPSRLTTTATSSSHNHSDSSQTTSNTSNTSNNSLCREYDLYSVIHHIGALGGGHYVNTTRFDATNKSLSSRSVNTTSSASTSQTMSQMTKKFVKSLKALTNNNNSNSNTVETLDSSHHPIPPPPNTSNYNNNNSSGSTTNEATTTTTSDQSEPLPLPSSPSRDYRWFTFNDNIVSEVSDLSDINSPSAYVLFYLRKDLQDHHDIQSLLQSQLLLATTTTTEEQEENPSSREEPLNASSSHSPNPGREASTTDPTANTTANTVNTGSTPRRHQYILSKKPLPTKKFTTTTNDNNTSSSNSNHSNSNSSNHPISQSQSSRTGQPAAMAGSGKPIESEGDNNCLIS